MDRSRSGGVLAISNFHVASQRQDTPSLRVIVRECNDPVTTELGKRRYSASIACAVVTGCPACAGHDDKEIEAPAYLSTYGVNPGHDESGLAKVGIRCRTRP